MAFTSPNPTPSSALLPAEIRDALARVRVRAWSIATGLVLGFALFLATLILVLRGGADVGAHLGLLSVFLPGYSVTYLGSFIGLAYLFVIGYVLGGIASRVYNAFART